MPYTTLLREAVALEHEADTLYLSGKKAEAMDLYHRAVVTKARARILRTEHLLAAL